MMAFRIVTVSVFFLFVLSCATAPAKKEKAVAEKEPERQEEKAAGATEPTGKSAGDAEKTSPDKGKDAVTGSAETDAGKDAPRDPNYDGLKYVGPAQKDFSKGIEVYFAKGCDEAVESWKQAFAADKANGTVAYNLGLCFERRGKVAEAREWYRSALEARNQRTEALYNQALLDLRTGSIQASEYTRLAEKVQDLVTRYNFLAWLSFKQGKYDDAIKQAKLALKEDEMNVEAMVMLGAAYFQKNMLELADTIFSTAEQIDPNNFKLQRAYGFLQYRQGNKQKASEHFQKAKKINPELPEVSNMLAILAMEIEDFETARKELEFALKIAPEFREAKINLALALKGAGEYKQSRDILLEMEKRSDISKEMLRDVVYNLAILHLDHDIDDDKQTHRFDIASTYFAKYIGFVGKKDKVEQKRIDEYLKEAQIEKKKVEIAIKMRERQEAKKKKEEEEQRRYELYVKDFEEVKKKDTVDAYVAFFTRYPELDEDDERAQYARKRLEELKSGVATPPSSQPEPSPPPPEPSPLPEDAEK